MLLDRFGSMPQTPNPKVTCENNTSSSHGDSAKSIALADQLPIRVTVSVLGVFAHAGSPVLSWNSYVASRCKADMLSRYLETAQLNKLKVRFYQLTFLTLAIFHPGENN